MISWTAVNYQATNICICTERGSQNVIIYNNMSQNPPVLFTFMLLVQRSSEHPCESTILLSMIHEISSPMTMPIPLTIFAKKKKTINFQQEKP
jgi:hypothetical protein